MATANTLYQAPALRVHGTLEALTQGQSTGSRFDGNFVVGQPVPDPLDIFS